MRKFLIVGMLLLMTGAPALAANPVQDAWLKSFQTPQGQNRIASVVRKIHIDIFQGPSGMGETLPASMADARLSDLLTQYKAYPPVEYTGYELLISSIRRALANSIKHHGVDTVTGMGQICISAPECLQKNSLTINLYKPGRGQPFILDTYRWKASGFQFEKTESFDS